VNQVVENNANAVGVLAERQQFVTIFFSTFDARVSLVGLLLQLFVTSRALRYWGVRGSLFILPVIALANYSNHRRGAHPGRDPLGKISRTAPTTRIQNTLRHALFLPTSREAKYTMPSRHRHLCTRFGDVLQQPSCSVGTRDRAGVGGFAWLTTWRCTLVWLGVAVQIAREHRKNDV
jgi:AAA family ATP:ADP antiporter